MTMLFGKIIVILCFFSTYSVSWADDRVLKMWSDGPINDALQFKKDAIEHFSVFKASEFSGGYNHIPKIVYFNGLYYAMWSNHRYGEDGSGQRVLYSVSSDGKVWSDYKILFDSFDEQRPCCGTGVNLSSSKWIIFNDELYARVWSGATVAWSNLDKTEKVSNKDKVHFFEVRENYGYLYRRINKDGTLGPIFVLNKNKIPDSLLPFVSRVDNPESYSAFDLNNVSFRSIFEKTKIRLTEPVLFDRKDGMKVVLFRDDSFSHRKWASFSVDGRQWSSPQPTNIPDSPSASDVLELKNGMILLIGNHTADKFDENIPKHYDRDRLLLSVSYDGGYTFGSTISIRSGISGFRIPGVKGRGGGAQYPNAIEVDGKVLVIYSLGKEDIEVAVLNKAIFDN